MRRFSDIAALFTLLAAISAPGGLAQGPLARPNGLAIVKEIPSDKDEFATSFHFFGFTRHAVTTNFNRGGPGPELIVENYKICALAEFGDVATRDLVTPDHRQNLQAKHDELQELTKRFPTARGKLKPVIESILSDIARFDSGQVRYASGAWTPRASYETMMEAHKRAAQAEAKMYSDAQDERRRREENLTAIRNGLAARWLISGYTEYLNLLWSTEGPKTEAGLGVSLPPSIMTDSIPLPTTAWKEIGLKEGKGIFSPALLYVQAGRGLRSFRLAFAITYEEDEITNASDLKWALNVLSQIDESLASWLPSAVVSGSTQLEFIRNSGQQKSEVKVRREIAGRTCELTMTAPATHDDGTAFSIACLTVF